MNGKKSVLQGSTLAETLVMMIVAGVVLMGAMEGMTLFNRLLLSRTEALLARKRTTDGYYRMESLVAEADSVRMENGNLVLFRAEKTACIEIHDSALIYRMIPFCDTLLYPVEYLRVARGLSGADTVLIELCQPAGRFILRFSLRPSPEDSYHTQIEKIENGYGYDE